MLILLILNISIAILIISANYNSRLNQYLSCLYFLCGLDIFVKITRDFFIYNSNFDIVVGGIGFREKIMVTSMDDKEIILDSFEAGAVDYVLKGDFLTLPHAIRNIKKNKSPIQILSQEYVSLKHEKQLASLTVSERAIFDLIIAGASRTQIEIKLNKSTNTIRKPN